MKATFTYAIRYLVKATCDSPMRTGNAANDIERVLTSHTGLAMLQGSSIAGAMRAWIKDPKKQDLLFGNKEREGSIRITDALFNKWVAAGTRPRVKLNRDTATVENKFDIATLPSKAVCSFDIFWLGHKEAVYVEKEKLSDDGTEKEIVLEMQSLGEKDASDLIENCLRAVQSGEITFGAQRNNGFGRMQLSVSKRSYDLTDQEDRNAWLNDQTEGAKKRELAPLPSDDIVFAVEAYIPSILIKSSVPKREKEKSVQEYFSEDKVPILPGSSLKGAMRAHMQKIAPFLFPEKDARALITELMGNTPIKKENAIAGKLVWTEARLAPGTKKTVETTRIRINRLTAGTIQRALITERPICGTWNWQIRIPAKEQTGALLVLYALRDLGLGIYQLGGTKAVGRGRVDKITVHISEGKETAELKVEEGKIMIEDATGIVAGWDAQMGGSEHGH